MQIFENKIPSIYPNDLNGIKTHQNKATSHTSKNITIFFEKMKLDMSIKCMPFQHINANKFLCMDYCDFGLIKRTFSMSKSTID